VSVLANASVDAFPSFHFHRLGLSPKYIDIGQSVMFLKSKTSPHHVINHRCILSSTAITLHKEDDGKLSPATLHSLYHEQMKEIQNEREAIFGSDNSDESSSGSPDLSQTAKSYFPSTESSSQPPSRSPLSSFTTPSPGTTPQFLPPGWNAEEAYAERESLFAFTEEEQYAWNNRGMGNSQTVAAHNNMLRELIREAPANHAHDHAHDHDLTEAKAVSPPSSPFSHLTPRGDGASMVDVGNKATTRRVALARSVVVFPPEVLSAFQVSSSSSGGKSEMIGPKGPIFETAKIAGILGAK